jgi:hypothetical protein
VKKRGLEFFQDQPEGGIVLPFGKVHYRANFFVESKVLPNRRWTRAER